MLRLLLALIYSVLGLFQSDAMSSVVTPPTVPKSGLHSVSDKALTTSFTPVANVTDGERYTIAHDYLGTQTQAYDSESNLVWEMLLDVYGEVMESRGDRSLVPFRYQGQYEDAETGLYYNRFRYYSPEMGMYISSDPIGLAGNNPTLYGYVQDVNTWPDPWGLDCAKNKKTSQIRPLKKGNKVYSVYGGDSRAGGASWARISPNKYKNYRSSAALPSGKESGVTNTGRFVIEGVVEDPSKVVMTRKAIPLDGHKGGIDEYIIPDWENNGAIEIIRVSGVNPEF